jgi:peptidoglycan/xylan/chitin deacetylase (PgdA/CDA1 family)
VDRISRRFIALVLVGLSVVGVSSARGDGTAGAPASGGHVEAADVGPGRRKHEALVRAERADKKRSAIRLALTVDDLPGGGPEVLGYSHVQMVKDIIAVLHAHRIADAAGFIVGQMIETRPERFEALDAWVRAGFLVGNHSYSHDRLAELGLQRFSADIIRNREVVDPLEKRLAQQHSYFRFPYLEEGTTSAERSALWQLLQHQRYTLVRASVVFSDTDWAEAYLRCQQKNDQASLRALDRSYVASALAHLQWSIAAADDVLGHPIPHVLLLHVNVPTALNLDALLRAFEAQGVQFIGLEEAMREPAYSAYYDVPDGELLGQASLALGRPHPPKLLDLDLLFDRFCR